MHKSTYPPIFTYRRTFSNEKEIQIAQIRVDMSAGYVRQWCNIDTVTFAQCCLWNKNKNPIAHSVSNANHENFDRENDGNTKKEKKKENTGFRTSCVNWTSRDNNDECYLHSKLITWSEIHLLIRNSKYMSIEP